MDLETAYKRAARLHWHTTASYRSTTPRGQHEWVIEVYPIARGQVDVGINHYDIDPQGEPDFDTIQTITEQFANLFVAMNWMRVKQHIPYQRLDWS